MKAISKIKKVERSKHWATPADAKEIFWKCRCSKATFVFEGLTVTCVFDLIIFSELGVIQ